MALEIILDRQLLETYPAIRLGLMQFDVEVKASSEKF